MKLKNLNNRTNQELIDVVTQTKAYLQANELEYTEITLANYQIEEENDTLYFEIYESTLFIESETTLEEAQEQQFDNEKCVKEYKTRKGLLQAFLNDHDINGSYYRILTQI
ncbi:hypothetical protein [Staphylococcus hominis]|uniref:hypothetical protein n=1 Tax=Staphylococcus hominis TaxID=1290 RepID=UPI0011A5C1E1|nr:hypothetical protein [Staphylococcus hominis]HDM8576029.1 hypothetical protein [Staphylococcus aureus]